jgi:hypothetical protein
MAVAEDNYQYRMVPSDLEAARVVLLTRADLGVASNWKLVEADGDPVPSGEGACLRRSDSLTILVTGEAQSKFQYVPATLAINNGALVFHTSAMLENWWRQQFQPSAVACLREFIVSGGGVTGGPSRFISFKRLPFTRFGSHTIAFRAQFRAGNGPYELIDIVLFARGRTVGVLTMASAVDTPKMKLSIVRAEQQLASIMFARMTPA